MTDLFTGQPIPVEEKVAVIGREVVMRRRVYPNLVARGTMKQAAADRGIEVMEAVLADYTKQPWNPTPGDPCRASDNLIRRHPDWAGVKLWVAGCRVSEHGNWNVTVTEGWPPNCTLTDGFCLDDLVRGHG